MRRFVRILGIFCGLHCMILFAAQTGSAFTVEAISAFDQANQDYREGKYELAAQAYLMLSDQYPDAAVFLYNLGNSYFRLERTGDAILAYEQAKRLDPRNGDISRNLSFVRGLLEYRVEDKRNWYIRAGERILENFKEDEVEVLWSVLYLLLFSSWAFSLFVLKGSPWGWKRKTLLVALFISLAVYGAKNVESRIMSDAIVMKPDTEIKYGPSDADQVAFRLGEGLKVYVRARRPKWSRVVLVNGESGWVKNENIAEVMS